MKITKIETFATEFVCFVKATTEDGLTGFGQTAPYHADITAQVIHRQIAPWVLKQDEDNLEQVIQTVLEKEHKFPGSYLRRALAGFETAIWDLRGHREGKSVCELLGGTPGPVRAYGSSMRRDITPTNEAKRLTALQDKYGFDAFKFRIGSECGHDQDEWPGRTEEIVSLIRQTVDPSTALLVDANSCYSPENAIKVGKLLEANGICHFEEPCPYWEFDQTKQVTNALSIDVTGGEQDCELQNWQRMISERVVDIVQPDICYLGGMLRTLEVAKMAAAKNIPVTPHCANLSMVTLFTMHLLRAIPNAGKYLEFSIEGADYYPWQYDLFVTSPFEIENGEISVTNTPGWGVEIQQQWLDKSCYQLSC